MSEFRPDEEADAREPEGSTVRQASSSWQLPPSAVLAIVGVVLAVMIGTGLNEIIRQESVIGELKANISSNSSSFSAMQSQIDRRLTDERKMDEETSRAVEKLKDGQIANAAAIEGMHQQCLTVRDLVDRGRTERLAAQTDIYHRLDTLSDEIHRLELTVRDGKPSDGPFTPK